MTDICSNSWLLLVLLNPLLLIIYVIDLVHKQTLGKFARTLITAGVISTCVFIVFALLGEVLFSVVFQAHFASFQLFGGLVFLIIGLDFVFKGPGSIELLRGDRSDLAPTIAMPILIGPGTISASVLIGKRLPPGPATISILLAVSLSILLMVVIKHFFDISRQKTEALMQRYLEIAGRVMALYVGTVSIEMIMSGLKSWVLEIAPALYK